MFKVDTNALKATCVKYDGSSILRVRQLSMKRGCAKYVRVVRQGVGRALFLINIRIRNGRSIGANGARRINGRLNSSERAQLIFSVLSNPSRMKSCYGGTLYEDALNDVGRRWWLRRVIEVKRHKLCRGSIPSTGKLLMESERLAVNGVYCGRLSRITSRANTGLLYRVFKFNTKRGRGQVFYARFCVMLVC